VQVDQSRKHRGAGELESRRARRVDPCGDGLDAVAADENRAGAERRGAGPVDQGGGGDEDAVDERP
jgi:hypothetical protein